MISLVTFPCLCFDFDPYSVTIGGGDWFMVHPEAKVQVQFVMQIVKGLHMSFCFKMLKPASRMLWSVTPRLCVSTFFFFYIQK